MPAMRSRDLRAPCAIAFAPAFALGGCSADRSEPVDLSGYEGRIFEHSPFAEFYEKAYGTVQPDPAEQARVERDQLMQQEELFAECMGEQGFEHVPYVAELDLRWIAGSEAAEAELAGLSQVEFAEQYGYGVFANPYTPPARGMQAENPNDAIWLAMSEAEQEEWYAAAFGDGSGAEHSAAATVEQVGCTGWVALQTSVSDGAVADALADGAAGQDVDSIDPETTARLREIEIQLAVADATCQDNIDYVARSEQIQWRVEQTILDDNADLVAGVLGGLPPAD